MSNSEIVTASIYEISSEIQTADDLRLSPDLFSSAMESFVQTASGPLTQIPSSIAYMPFSSIMSSVAIDTITKKLPATPASSGHAKIRHQTLLERFNPGSRLGQIEFNFDTSIYSPYFVAEPGKKYATMLQMLQYPFSVGSIHIPPSATRTTVYEAPVIDPRYYQGTGGEVDLITMAESQKFADKITRTLPLSSIIVQRVFPPSTEDDDEDFQEYVRDYTITDWHPVGTCSMGPYSSVKVQEYTESDFIGVVDSKLRVHGVKGLRIVDASIMPLQISAHLQATVYAIAEKGASMILDDYKKSAT
jgi:choline dehydrogenase-like flavoprotein